MSQTVDLGLGSTRTGSASKDCLRLYAAFTFHMEPLRLKWLYPVSLFGMEVCMWACGEGTSPVFIHSLPASLPKPLPCFFNLWLQAVYFFYSLIRALSLTKLLLWCFVFEEEMLMSTRLFQCPVTKHSHRKARQNISRLSRHFARLHDRPKWLWVGCAHWCESLRLDGFSSWIMLVNMCVSLVEIREYQVHNSVWILSNSNRFKL